MEDSRNCNNLANRYLAITRAGRLRGLGSHLFHPENRTAQTRRRTNSGSQGRWERGTRDTEVQNAMWPDVEMDARAIEQIRGRP
jgi:hypothetical protein